ncbi:NAD-dependent epimerase/dehydratase family protein [Tautonia plasticadhaerens]|uniref:3 beta-hydroxysteroid dehydrogenase/Delta 5-->4-isomerase n=1 Tax=Tautonia plasticadhaerens TaxID=2527974 RepID=A0A518H7L4_9BACT|nr:NAD(P)-dependent oxidoreductase [Tautonia plasticadhaerens]QDV36833.1 3 beta-hydroxysteroid dehydrogenase/Delta 5-->4-isomerase [Tautonia plasticadhaerens]
MHIAVTGATGFLGRYVVSLLAERGHSLRCWYRMSSDRGGFEPFEKSIEWVPGSLRDKGSELPLLDGCDGVVHAALDRPGPGFIGAEGDLIPFAEANLMGSLRLFQAAQQAGIGRFVFVSTCAVYDSILDDRPLDEAHPTWPGSHYGAHKAALEAFVHSFGKGGMPICSLRPTGIYGLARPVERSKWFGLVRDLVEGREVSCRTGGKEVHAADVARAVGVLLDAPAEAVAGRSFNCYDLYVSEYDVASIAREAGAGGRILGEQTRPKHQIETGTLRALGMDFGGRAQLEDYVRALVSACR